MEEKILKLRQLFPKRTEISIPKEKPYIYPSSTGLKLCNSQQHSMQSLFASCYPAPREPFLRFPSAANGVGAGAIAASEMCKARHPGGVTHLGGAWQGERSSGRQCRRSAPTVSKAQRYSERPARQSQNSARVSQLRILDAPPQRKMPVANVHKVIEGDS